MAIAVTVERRDGKYTATVPGVPALLAVADSRDKALAAIRTELEVRISSGELVFVEPELNGVLALLGKYKDDPDWQEMWKEIGAEAYRYRDELKAQEFPD